MNIQINTEANKRIRKPALMFDSADRWRKFTDVIPNFDNTTIRADALLEHMNMTKDESDYLWYTMRYVPLH